MSPLRFGQKSCEQVRSYLDSYLNDELRVETNGEIQRHLENCLNCSAELGARGRLRRALREAVESETVPVALQAKVREQIRRGPPAPLFSPTRERLGLAAALVIVACLGVWGSFSVRNRQAGEHLVRADLNPLLSEGARRILNIGLGDHIHCAIEDEATRTHFGEIRPEYAGLLPLINEKLGNTFEVAAAHHCEVDGREFVHFILKNRDATLSLAVTKKNGESFPDDRPAPVLNASGVTLHQGHSPGYEVVGFEAGSHLAFVISDLRREENFRIASIITPPVSDLLTRLASHV